MKEKVIIGADMFREVTRLQKPLETSLADIAYHLSKNEGWDIIIKDGEWIGIGRDGSMYDITGTDLMGLITVLSRHSATVPNVEPVNNRDDGDVIVTMSEEDDNG